MHSPLYSLGIHIKSDGLSAQFAKIIQVISSVALVVNA